ncbi:hypothetical protein [Hallella mizrahii]|uniref:Uncharacterized protein n=1 Tax=Hallella mizrahii TaxID=2606637 RepID=A0A7K0KH59_9BACT|nr:hypothetical protein [Hallella mizrahii]MST85238.1 hypothetical protein [Hallella mizrahii]
MDSNINKFQMNLFRLEKDVRKLEKEYLDEVNEDSLKKFAVRTKQVAMAVLEEYYFSVDNFYTKGEFKIQDEGKFNDFMDFHDGYRAQMKQWIAQNKIVIQQSRLSEIPVKPTMDSEGNLKEPAVVAGAGAIIVVALAIFSKSWLAVAAALLTAGLSAASYKRNVNKKERDYQFKLQQYEIQVKQTRDKMTNGIIADLKEWLSQAEKQSDKILASFNVE